MESSPVSPAGRRGARRREGQGPGDAALVEDLAAIYRRADALAAACRHDGCGRCARCCQFARSGREPYVTSIELAFILRAWRGLGVRASRLGRAAEQGSCPLLTSEHRCGAYHARPLGCRTFWCRAAASDDRAAARRAVLELVREVKSVAERHRPGGELGRPLGAALRALARSS